MVAGVFVLAAPVAALGVASYGIVNRMNHRRLVQAKEALFQEALRKRDAIARELAKRQAATGERLAYLASLNASLQRVIKDLEADLGAAG